MINNEKNKTKINSTIYIAFMIRKIVVINTLNVTKENNYH